MTCRNRAVSPSNTMAWIMSANSSTLVRREVLDQPEVEERHLPARPEQVVARVGVAVERRQPVQAAEHEPVDGLGRQVALVLVPGQHGVEADALGQLGGEHPAGRQRRHHVGHVDERVAAVEVGEQLLVAGLAGRSRAPRRPGPAAPRSAVPGRSRGSARPIVPKSRPALSRSARIASSTPGYWTLTATARPSRVMARWTCPIDADGDRQRVPLGEQLRRVGRRARARRRPAASSADMGGASCCRPASASRTWSGRPMSR